MSSSPTFLLLPLLTDVHSVIAVPLWKRQSTESGTDGGSGGGSGFNPAIYIPIIAILLVLAMIAVGSALRRRALRRPTTAANASRVAEATANQLTGRNASNNNSSAQQPRRNRRNRQRRASQLSVTSLPLYMEEAGDTELVLVRGNRERIDAVPEHLESQEPGARDDSLIQDGSEHDSSRVADSSRRSYDSADSMQEGRALVTSPLMENHRRSQSEGSDGRHAQLADDSVPHDDAPPYSEVSIDSRGPYFSEVNLNDDGGRPQTQNNNHSQGQNQSASTSGNNNTNSTVERAPNGTASNRLLPLRNMPNLRNLFTRTPSETNNASGSGRSLATSSSRQHLLSHQRSTSTFSISSSLSHLTPTSSRLTVGSRPFERGTNPSQLSLASISAPLQHTLTKTEFNYPKNGPTKEQMKFLGSRESLALFGVPFGSAAVAYSRVEPPPFETSGSGSGSSEQPGEGSSSHDTTGEGRRSAEHDGREVANDTDAPTMLDPTGAENIEAGERSSDEPSSAELEGSPDAPIRKDSGPSDQHRESILSSGTYETAQSSSSADNSSKMNIPVTIVREPSPGPPTPPPTPPRQFLSISDGEARISTSIAGPL